MSTARAIAAISDRVAPLVGLAGLALGATSGCVKPEARFDDFSDRVIDAGGTTIECAGGDGGAVDGDYLLGIKIAFAPDDVLQFRCAMALAGATLDMACTPLTVEGRADVGDALGERDIPVADDGGFVAHIAGMVDGSANPISGSDIQTSEEGLELQGVVCGEAICGLLAGEIEQPPVGAVTGTWAAIPVDDGATGDALPDPIVACPTDVPDAGPPDAPAPDAAP